MPWIGEKDGERVIPEGVEDGEEVTCIDCGGEMHPRGPTSDGRARHFAHNSSADSKSCSAGSGGESETHRKWVSLATSRLKELYDESEWKRCEPEVTLDLDRILSPAEYRRADVLLEFEEPDPLFGKGIIIEVQHKNEDKDADWVQHDYHRLGYSVFWAYECDFESDRCILSREEIEDDAYKVFVWMVPDAEEWTPPFELDVEPTEPEIQARFHLPKWLAQERYYMMYAHLSRGILPQYRWTKVDFDKFTDRPEFVLTDHVGRQIAYVKDATHYIPAPLLREDETDDEEESSTEEDNQEDGEEEGAEEEETTSTSTTWKRPDRGQATFGDFQ